MNTPITDDYKERWVTHFPCGMTIYEVARRLETDRAALMEALEFYGEHMLLGYEITDSGQVAKSALAAARANFTTP